MGNTPSTAFGSKWRGIPLALVQRADGEDAGQDSRDQGLEYTGPSSHAFGLSSRTAPINEAENVLKRSSSNRRTTAMQFWPDHLEEEYIFEEVFEYESQSIHEASHSINHLVADLELHTCVLSVSDSSSLLLGKKRIGRRRCNKLTVLTMDSFSCQETLDFSRRSIALLTGNIGRFRGIRSLFLSENNLTCLPQEIGLLQCLEVLQLSSNKLQSLPESIGFLKCLRELRLDNNRLDSLPKSIGSLARLKILNISSNKFSIVPREVGRLERLVAFEAENNMIQWLPAELSLLKQLRRIDVEANPLLKEESFAEVAKKMSSWPLPSMLEVAACRIVREDAHIISTLPRSLCSYLRRAEECVFCHGPFIGHRYVRIRMLCRQDHMIPFLYFLCAPHWDDERGRLQAIFQPLPDSAPKSTVNTKYHTRKSTILGLPLSPASPNAIRNQVHKSKSGTMPLRQLVMSPSLPELPKYSTLPACLQGGGARSDASFEGKDLISLERYPDLQTQEAIAVDQNWLALPTELSYHQSK